MAEKIKTKDLDEYPSLDELYQDPIYWEDFYSDDRELPDNYEIWPGQIVSDNGIHIVEEDEED